MKHNELPLLSATQRDEAARLGGKLARLRRARGLRQADVAVRAGLSRSTVVLTEAGDVRRTVGQLLRYLDAVAPSLTLLDVLQETDPSLKALTAHETTKRVRKLSDAELEKLDF